MKQLAIYVLLSTTFIINQAFASKAGKDLSEQDIVKSTHRIQHAFTPSSEALLIQERGTAVGQISSFNDEFYVSYRPSLGLEILNCTDKSFLPLTQVGLNLPGHAHQGLTKLFSPSDIDTTVVSPFVQYKQKTQIPTEQITIFVDGMSAGAHRAVETAIYLKQHPDTKNHSLIVLRYGDARTFNDTAVSSIHNLIGKNNILSFHAQGDRIVEFMDLPNTNSYLGQRIQFLATESEDYQRRVRERSYTNMIPAYKPYLSNPGTQALARMFFGQSADFITPELWEMHQPITYSQLSPLAFRKLKEIEIVD